MGKIVSIINRKGGVGKTTLSVGLAEAIVSEFKQDCVIVDLDPQASASRFLLNEEGQFENAVESKQTLTGYLTLAENDPKAARENLIRRMCHSIKARANVDLALVANSDDYWDYEVDQIRARKEKELSDRLNYLLTFLAKKYDYVIVDCPPGQSIASESAAKASDLIICPITPERMALWGKELLAKYLSNVAREVKVRFVISRKQENQLSRDFISQVSNDGQFLSPKGGGSGHIIIISQKLEYQRRIEKLGFNKSLSWFWGGTAVQEIKAFARAVQEELNT